MPRTKSEDGEAYGYALDVRRALKSRLKMYAAQLGVSASKAASDLLDKQLPHYTARPQRPSPAQTATDQFASGN